MKHILLSLIVILLTTITANAQMVTAWTTTIKPSVLPSNAYIPTVDALASDVIVRKDFDVKLLNGATWDNTNDSTAFRAICEATKVKIDDEFLVPIWGIDTSLNFTGRIVITSVNRMLFRLNSAQTPFSCGDYTHQYFTAVEGYRVGGYFEWGAD